MENSLNHQLLCKHYLEGRSIGELAVETGLTQDAIDSRIRRGVRKLRARAMEDGLAGEAVR